jgi:hypothetical protein
VVPPCDRVTTATPQTLELLGWVAARPRTYAEAIEAWRSNCPRLAVWDDAVTSGLVRAVPGRNGNRPAVELTPAGEAVLAGGAP